MREGVLQKLSEQHIKRFPTTENKSTGALSSIVVFESCYCEKKQMAEFGSCRKWFHRMCEPITGEIFENESIEWNCLGCSSCGKKRFFYTDFTQLQT